MIYLNLGIQLIYFLLPPSSIIPPTAIIWSLFVLLIHYLSSSVITKLLWFSFLLLPSSPLFNFPVQIRTQFFAPISNFTDFIYLFWQLLFYVSVELLKLKMDIAIFSIPSPLSLLKPSLKVVIEDSSLNSVKIKKELRKNLFCQIKRETF